MKRSNSMLAKLGWVGIPGPYDTACHFSRESGITTVDDWFEAKRPIKISSIGPGTSLSDVPKLLRAALNLPLEMVEGYKGGAEARLAVENGEVDGLCASWQATKVSWRSQIESGKIRVVLQATQKSHPDLKNVPLAMNYAKTEEARTLLRVADNVHVYQFPYSVAPNTPPERLQILQQAFVKTLRDRELVAEADKAQLEGEPIDGPTTAKTFASLYELTPSVIAKLKELLIPKTIGTRPAVAISLWSSPLVAQEHPSRRESCERMSTILPIASISGTKHDRTSQPREGKTGEHYYDIARLSTTFCCRHPKRLTFSGDPRALLLRASESTVRLSRSCRSMTSHRGTRNSHPTRTSYFLPFWSTTLRSNFPGDSS